ncbi:MAG TPA: hypothetical protein PLO23_01015, partial [Alphaproteobacteria bacterium]|nr:hypothetical protein [Alphaproteobacteria bacterium]
PDGTPVHALISGKAGEFDRTIRLEEAPRYGTLGEEQVFKVVAEDVGEGAKPGQPVTLTLKQEGGEAVSVETLTGEPTEVKVKINHAGPNVLTIEASALEGELSTANNRIVTSIQGNRESVNVLVLSGTVS